MLALAASYRPGTGWTASVEVIPAGRNQPRHYGQYDVAIDPSGNALVAWWDASGILARFYRAGAGWDEIERAASAPYRERDYPHPPLAVLDGQGNAFVFWSAGISGFVLGSSRFEPGRGWAPPESLSALGGVEGSRPAAALDKRGTLVAVWSQVSGDEVTIWSRRYVAQP